MPSIAKANYRQSVFDLSANSLVLERMSKKLFQIVWVVQKDAGWEGALIPCFLKKP